VFIEIFNDKLTVSNKGKLFFDKKYLGTISLPKKPLLFDVFYRLDLTEKVGSEISRIKSQCCSSGVRTEFDAGDTGKCRMCHKPILRN